MIDDLIDLYFYIKSTKDLKDLKNREFTVNSQIHLVEYSNVMNPNDGSLRWRLKIVVGSYTLYRTIFIYRTKISIYENGLQWCEIKVSEKITDDDRSILNNYISEDEINVINEIYSEMKNLTDRSNLHDRTC